VRNAVSTNICPGQYKGLTYGIRKIVKYLTEEQSMALSVSTTERRKKNDKIF
jgi:hypothetical protein